MSRSLAIDAREINPLTDFLRNSKAHITRIKETKRPEVLTVNGKAEVVVVDVETYQELIDHATHAAQLAGIREALKSLDRGDGKSLEDFEAELGQLYGV